MYCLPVWFFWFACLEFRFTAKYFFDMLAQYSDAAIRTRAMLNPHGSQHFDLRGVVNACCEFAYFCSGQKHRAFEFVWAMVHKSSVS